MAFPSQQQIDIIATQILLDTKQALLSLKAWNNSVTDGQAKIRLLKELVKSTAAQMDGDFKRAAAAVNKFAAALNINPAVIRQIGADLQGAGQAGQKAGDSMEGAFKRTFSAVNAARIALGALVAMFLFRAIQAVEQFFTQAIEQATKFEDTLYRLQNAERALSMEGVEVTLSGLKQGIIDIQKLLPIFSKEDIASLVGTLSVSTKQLGLNEQQILDLAKAIGILNVRSEKQEDIQTTAQHVLSSLLTGNAKGISALGIAFTDNTMKAEAMAQGFLEADEAVSDLTENEKGLVKLGLLMRSTGQELEGIDEYLDSNSAKLQKNKAAWNDLLTSVGSILLPLIPSLTTFFELISDGFTMAKVLLIEVGVLAGRFGAVWQALFRGQIKSMEDFTRVFTESTESIRDAMTNVFFNDAPDDAPDWFMRGWGDRIKEDAETATNALGDMYDAAEENEDAMKALEDLDQKLQEIMLDAKQAQEDLDLKLGQKQADLDLEYIRKGEDAAIDHAQKLEDINQDALDKIADARAKAREDEKKAEDDLLQKLKELRQRFLLDLEDALHARDARQVIRLIKEYKLEKQNLLDKKKLEDQQRKDSLAEDLRNTELERQRRIAQENIEYQRKLADLRKSKAREQEELALWYKREQDDIQRNIEQKIQKLIAGYIAEEKLHAEHQAAIAEIISKYVGYDMAMVDRLAQFMATRFQEIGALAAAMGSLNFGFGFNDQTNPFAGQYGIPVGAQNSLTLSGASGGANTSSSSTGGGIRPRNRRAEGGTIVADKPTTVLFGERGLEAATFTPIGRSGKDVGKIFSDVEGAGLNGTIVVAVDLSPDLEGRVVRRSMDGVANIIGRVNNRKVS